MSHTTIITNKYEKDVFMKNHKAIICYSSVQCPVCLEMKPLYDRIACRYKNRVSSSVIYIDENDIKMNTTPVFEGYVNGKMIKCMEGVDAVALKQFFGSVINF